MKLSDPRAFALLALGLAALIWSGCPRTATSIEEPDASPGSVRKKREPKHDPATADIPLDRARPADPARQPRPPSDAPSQVSTRYILITQAGRTKPEAHRRAKRLVLVARQSGVSFTELARRYSETHPAERGALVAVSRGQMPAAFERAAFGMGVGQVSEAVETPRGYYVIMREEVEEYSSAHILLQYKGAKSAPIGVTRKREEALKKAEVVRAQAVKSEANFAVLAERYSDSPSRIRGGALRPMAPGQMPPEYDRYIEALRKLAVGEVSPVVETPFGFHVIKRLKLERIRASHVLIAFNDAEVAPREERTRRDAEVLARKVLREAQAHGADFAALAKKHSDHAASSEKGGDLGLFARGTMPPRFEQIAFGLKPGQVSDVVETPLGFHIILRTE